VRGVLSHAGITRDGARRSAGVRVCAFVAGSAELGCCLAAVRVATPLSQALGCSIRLLSVTCDQAAHSGRVFPFLGPLLDHSHVR